MARFVWINTPALGHTNPTLPVVAELVRRGHQVEYFSYPAFASAIEKAGATFYSYAGFTSFGFDQFDTNLFRLAATMLEATVEILPALLPRVEALAPDVVIHDSLTPWGRAVGELLDVGRVCSVTTFAMNNWATIAAPTQVGNLLSMAPAALPRLPAYLAARATLRSRYGVDVPSILSVFTNPGPRNIVFSSRAFQPAAGSFPQDAWHFVGPPLQNRSDEHYALPVQAAGRPLIYIALGTLFNERPDFYRTCIAACRDAPFHVLISVGHKVDAAALGPLPPNITVERFVPQVGVLQQADLFLTHGGMNSTHEGLYYNVPLLVAPQAADQEWVAQRVARLGAGRVLRTGSGLTPQRLREAIDGLMVDGAAREAACSIGASLRAGGGALAAASVLEELLS